MHVAHQQSKITYIHVTCNICICMARWKVMLTDTGCTAKNSMSLLRQPGPLSTSVRGESTNYPFLPGKSNVIVI